MRETKMGKDETAMLGSRVLRRGYRKERNGPGKADWNKLPHGKFDERKLWQPPFPWACQQSHSSGLDLLLAFVPWEALKGLVSMAQKTSVPSSGRKIIMQGV